MTNLASNDIYKDLLKEVKQRIQSAQTKAAIAVNQELLLLYWEIGKMIITRQQQEKWGAKVITQLAKDVKKEFPNIQGFSISNLKYMRQFAKTYPLFQIGQVPLGQISWYHNITLLQKCPDLEEQTRRYHY